MALHFASAQAIHSVLSDSNAGPADRYRAVRAATERLVDGLAPEDTVAQSMEDASPAKWHLAHTTWFFETFVLEKAVRDYRPFHCEYRVLFNSYYNSVGEQFRRPLRGLITRPTLDEVMRYRRHVDRRMIDLLERDDGRAGYRHIVEVGLHHEQQHQELILTDLKHLLSFNPLNPVYREPAPQQDRQGAGAVPMRWREFEGGLHTVGHSGKGFAFDNESPAHRVYLAPFALASRPVTNAEFLAFIDDGGYRRPELWLSDGWALVQREHREAPLYWRAADGGWSVFTLNGLLAVNPDEPVAHVGYYEADAYARWAGARLPTEFEWETAARAQAVTGHFVESGAFHPRPAHGAEGLQQMFGDVWEWTSSAYGPYPGYRPPDGELAEYNGKFMCNQVVLRGGSCATPQSHIRPTYRNFFYPTAQWQFSGLRLARDETS